MRPAPLCVGPPLVFSYGLVRSVPSKTLCGWTFKIGFASLPRYHRIRLIKYLNFCPGNGLVNASAKFSSDLTFAILKVPAAIDSLTLWYAIALCFFLSGDVGIVALMTTELLSQKTLVGPSMGMPNILNVYLNASIISTQILIAINSEPKVDDSTVF